MANIHVPPLRERRAEIPVLVDEFLDHFAQLYGRERPRSSAATMHRFMEYPWPGNVREIEIVLKRTVVLRTEEWVLADLAPATAADGAPAPLSGPPGAPSSPVDEDERLGLRPPAPELSAACRAVTGPRRSRGWRSSWRSRRRRSASATP